jgi:hypothetical protein
MAEPFKIHLFNVMCNQLTVTYSYGLQHVVMYFTQCGGYISGRVPKRSPIGHSLYFSNVSPLVSAAALQREGRKLM